MAFWNLLLPYWAFTDPIWLLIARFIALEFCECLNYFDLYWLKNTATSHLKTSTAFCLPMMALRFCLATSCYYCSMHRLSFFINSFWWTSLDSCLVNIFARSFVPQTDFASTQTCNFLLFCRYCLIYGSYSLKNHGNIIQGTVKSSHREAPHRI